MLKALTTLRKDLHRNPEISGQEKDTALRIKGFLKDTDPTEIIEDIGGHGFAAVYEFSEKGPIVMIRCELDALPIEEENQFEHRSLVQGVSHKCGHDGHMAIVAGVGLWLKEQNFKKGKVVLLFQPAEETGKGAHSIISDPKFGSIKPDYVFALHNIPGEAKHTIIRVKDQFSSTVQSLAVYLEGKESHASEPEKGVNPALAISYLIAEFDKLKVTDQNDPNFALLTPIHIDMGKQAYGISAGFGELHYTLRTSTEAVMDNLKNNLMSLVTDAGSEYKLKVETNWFDYFPSSVNDAFCNKMILKAAQTNNFELKEKPLAYKFGEDFGWYSQKYKSAMFGLGAGEDSPALHHADYDFPDDIIPTGLSMFTSIIDQILNDKTS
jgi:amidohydrolase